MTSPEDRAVLIKKLLAKAEAAGTTQEERDAYNAKATKLMIQWGIEEAMLQDAGRVAVEQIITRIFIPTAGGKTYAFEFCCIGSRVAKVFGAQGIMQRSREHGTVLNLIGFKSDVDRSAELVTSLMTQCAAELATFVKQLKQHYSYPTMSGSAKFQARRGFISGYATGVAAKLESIYATVVAETPRTALVLVDRGKQVNEWIDENMRVQNSRRQYDVNSRAAGASAGRRADVGQSRVGNSSPNQLGG